MVLPKYPCKGQYTLLLICLFAVAVQAQEQKAASALYTDLPIPDMSSFSLLHVNPYKIARPAGAKEFAADVLCIAKSDVTNAVPGIALEWAPYQTFDRNRISGDKNQVFTSYRQSLVLRNLQLSFAGVQDSFASRLSAGVSFVIPRIGVSISQTIHPIQPLQHIEMQTQAIRREESVKMVQRADADRRRAPLRGSRQGPRSERTRCQCERRKR